MTQNFMLHQYDEAFLNKTIKAQPKLAIFFALLCLFFAFFITDLTPKFIFCAGTGFMAFKLGKDALLKKQREQRINFILNSPLPSQLWHNQELRQLNLSLDQKQLIENSLQDYFILHALFPSKPLAMPSRNVDKLWHAFILDTRAYQDYCQKAFGKVFHHIPDYRFGDRQRNIELFTWQMGCRIQGISPANPITIPRLFATDMLLAGTVMGTMMWQSYQTQMALMYRDWHSQNSGSGGSSDSSGSSDINTPYNDSCDVGLTDGGDASCSSSDGGSADSSSSDSSSDSSCGGGCGGGGD